MTARSEALVARHLAWAKGGHAEICGLAGDTIEVRSTSSAPPGARLEGSLLGGAGPPAAITIKSYGTRREADGSFSLKGRLIDANRELRDRILAIADLPSASHEP